VNRIVGPEEGYVYDSMDETVRVKLTGEDTGGQFSLIEEQITPDYEVALRLNREHSETFYVLQGEITFAVGTRTVEAKAGTTVHVPANTPYAARADRAGRMLTILSPSGPEGALTAFAALAPEQVEEQAAARAIMGDYDVVDLADPPVAGLLGLYDALLAGDEHAMSVLVTGEAVIDTPLQGKVQGPVALAEFVSGQQAWLAARDAHPEFANIILSPERIVLEFVLYVTHEAETIDLPVALVADHDGEAVTAIRVYHSTWPLTGQHVVRGPIVQPPEQPPEEPAIVAAYTAGLREGNAAFVLSLFAENGYVREPSGARFKYVGPEGLREFYGPALDAGGIALRHCTATFDGHACAVEYIADAWAHVKLSPQAGVAVYELDGENKIRAARIYDDVAPPYE
jgi:mannose-6-phosphate isomerase-like protein (cupin superfamily)